MKNKLLWNDEIPPPSRRYRAFAFAARRCGLDMKDTDFGAIDLLLDVARGVEQREMRKHPRLRILPFPPRKEGQ